MPDVGLRVRVDQNLECCWILRLDHYWSRGRHRAASGTDTDCPDEADAERMALLHGLVLARYSLQLGKLL